jgi:hypothetical protein
VCKLEQDVEQLKAVRLAEFDLKWRPDGGVAASTMQGDALGDDFTKQSKTGRVERE